MAIKDEDKDGVSSFYIAEKFACRISRIDIRTELLYGYPIGSGGDCRIQPQSMAIADHEMLLVIAGMNVLLTDENGYFKILHSCRLDENDCNSHGFPDGPVSTGNVFKMGRPARISNTPHFLLVDTWAQAVRVIDIDAELMHTLCYDGNRTFFEFPEGAKTQLCHVILPTSILYIDTESVLYVGMENALWRAALHHGGMQVYTLPYRAKTLIGIIFRKICNSENREIRNPLFTRSIMH